MRKSEIEPKIIALLSEQIGSGFCTSLEAYALAVLRQKLADGTLTPEERMLLANGFLADLLEFDEKTGAPTGDTLTVEAMIDFVLSAGDALENQAHEEI